MALSSELSICCTGINSSKITERKKSAEILSNLLENKEVLRILNEEEANLRWKDVNKAIHYYLIKVFFTSLLLCSV